MGWGLHMNFSQRADFQTEAMKKCEDPLGMSQWHDTSGGHCEPAQDFGETKTCRSVHTEPGLAPCGGRGYLGGKGSQRHL